MPESQPPIFVAQHFFFDGTPVPDILTAEEACKFLRMEKATPLQVRRSLDYYRQSGLRSFRMGKQVRYRLEELLRFTKDREQRA